METERITSKTFYYEDFKTWEDQQNVSWSRIKRKKKEKEKKETNNNNKTHKQTNKKQATTTTTTVGSTIGIVMVVTVETE